MKKFLWIVILQFAAGHAFSQNKSIIYQIENCNSERRTALYTQQIDDIMYLAKDGTSFKKACCLHFSSNFKISADSLDVAALPFRKAIPKNYLDHGSTTTRLDTKPNEPAIWFDNILVIEDSKGGIKPLAAFKVIFEGSDAAKERVNPKIKDIVFITDPTTLKKYIAVIKQLKLANNVKTPQVVDPGDAPPPPIRGL